MKKGFRYFFVKVKDNFKNWVGRFKRAEFVSVVISAIVSAIAEFFRQALLVLNNTDFLIDTSFWQVLCEQRLEILHSIFNIFLITAIVWCITGIVDMLRRGSAAKSQLLSLSVLLMFAFSVAWYSCEILISLNWIKFFITLIIVTVLYTLLFMFLCFRKETQSEITNDHAIAAQMPELD